MNALPTSMAATAAKVNEQHVVSVLFSGLEFGSLAFRADEQQRPFGGGDLRVVDALFAEQVIDHPEITTAEGALSGWSMPFLPSR